MSPEENQDHINYLEMVTARFTLTYCKDATNSHITFLWDNISTVAYIDNLGGTKQNSNHIANMWMWCYEKNNWVVAAYLPGVLNIVAD